MATRRLRGRSSKSAAAQQLAREFLVAEFERCTVAGVPRHRLRQASAALLSSESDRFDVRARQDAGRLLHVALRRAIDVDPGGAGSGVVVVRGFTVPRPWAPHITALTGRRVPLLLFDVLSDPGVRLPAEGDRPAPLISVADRAFGEAEPDHSNAAPRSSNVEIAYDTATWTPEVRSRICAELNTHHVPWVCDDHELVVDKQDEVIADELIRLHTGDTVRLVE